jgi:hypothetical protein
MAVTNPTAAAVRKDNNKAVSSTQMAKKATKQDVIYPRLNSHKLEQI